MGLWLPAAWALGPKSSSVLSLALGQHQALGLSVWRSRNGRAAPCTHGQAPSSSSRGPPPREGELEPPAPSTPGGLLL